MGLKATLLNHIPARRSEFDLGSVSWPRRRCRRCVFAGGERVPPAPLGWYFYKLFGLKIFFPKNNFGKKDPGEEIENYFNGDCKFSSDVNALSGMVIVVVQKSSRISFS